MVTKNTPPGFTQDENFAFAPESPFVMFKRVESVTGISLRPREQTPNIKALIHALMDKDRQTKLDSFELFKRKFGAEIVDRNILGHELQDHDAHNNARPVSIMFCDLNHFKDYNTEFGQDTTDHILTAVAQTLKGFTRHKNKTLDEEHRSGENPESHDTLARRNSAGDEFLVLMPDAPEHVATQRIEMIKEKVSKTQFLVKDSNGQYAKLTNVTLASGVREMQFPLEEHRHENYFATGTKDPENTYYKQLDSAIGIAERFIDEAEKKMAKDKAAMKAAGSSSEHAPEKPTRPDIQRISPIEGIRLEREIKADMAAGREPNVVFVDATAKQVGFSLN